MIRKCTVCGRHFEVDINYIYINVCPECQAIDPRTRSEEDRLGELRVLIENVWREYRNLQDGTAHGGRGECPLC